MRRCVVSRNHQRENPNILNTIDGLSNLSTENWKGHWGPRQGQFYTKVDMKE